MPNASLASLRDAMTQAYRADETDTLEPLLTLASFPSKQAAHVLAVARSLAAETREYKKKQGKIDELLHQYDLSTEEGIALMCLAEALLRIPDKTTIDKFISDKISTADWTNHLGTKQSLFINATTWSLLLTGKIYSSHLLEEKNLLNSLKRAVSQIGVSFIRPIILKMMKAIGNQFVLGETIEAALERSIPLQKQGYRFSYDMLGEAARTQEDAKHYYEAYVKAIHAIGKVANKNNPHENPGISVKLSALSPRYDYTQYQRAIQEVTPLLLSLVELAKNYQIGLTVDAEEADRLDLSLDIFEKVFTNPALNDYEGFGLAIQAYQKRAPYVIDWLAALARQQQKRMMVRLVKGAYWDAEIKMSQVQGLSNYPVFTRKNSTDVSYLACAKKLFAAPDAFFPQFGTHNAYSAAAILEIAHDRRDYEFQCLQGMGRPLYDQVVDHNRYDRPCRIYAPVGTHRDLLGYLVRRLLENGANSSFLNKLSDDDIPLDKLIYDPVARIAALEHKPHPKIPLPVDIYHHWKNSTGIDLSNRAEWDQLKQQSEQYRKKEYDATSLIHDKNSISTQTISILSPADRTQLVGKALFADESDIADALAASEKETDWSTMPYENRAQILEQAADLFQQAMPELMSLLQREGGKCVLDTLSEVRETIDYCRYYAYRAREDLRPHQLPGPTGEMNQISLHPRGIVVCISPWNFPLAIFCGQILAALVTGNRVIAKPAEQTPLIAYRAVEILQAAGVPKAALQLILGAGETGAKLTSDSRIAGVIFTGSTETAKKIEQTLAHREGPIGFLIAETGGQNAMIVDSSALPEQVVMDVVQSSFNSAGQRCSALRVLFVQEEIAPKLLTMLKGYLAELTLGDPSDLATDIGPVIDADALNMLEKHANLMNQQASLLAQASAPASTKGDFFAPRIYELPNLDLLKREVFGPILHVIPYRANELDQVIEAIIRTGYGLTLGIHSRIDATINYITNRLPVGNQYVNRNMIGAVVGVQPFGGERLSGTGPKAGGPHYLPRLCVERCISINTTAVGGNARLVSLLEED